jgi:hypothetical protein
MPWSVPTSGHITSAAVEHMALKDPNSIPILEMGVVQVFEN